MAIPYRVISISPQMLKMKYASLMPEHIRGKSHCFAMVAIGSRGAASGILAAGYEKGSMTIEYIYVRPEDRRRGVGSALLASFLGMAKQNDFFPVYCFFTGDEVNRGIEGLILASESFIIERTPTLYRLTKEARMESKHYRKLLTQKSVCEQFYRLDKGIQNAFRHRLSRMGIPYLENLNSDEAHAKSYCFCITEEDQIISACFVCSRGENVMAIKYLYGNDIRSLIAVLGKTARELERDFPDFVLEFEVISQPAGIMADKMFGEITTPRDLCVARWTGLLR